MSEVDGLKKRISELEAAAEAREKELAKMREAFDRSGEDWVRCGGGYWYGFADAILDRYHIPKATP